MKLVITIVNITIKIETDRIFIHQHWILEKNGQPSIVQNIKIFLRL